MPLPLIGEVINKLKEAKYFNKLDLIWGYNNVWIKEEAPKELNAKAYAMTLKEEEALNQWLDEQLKAGLIVESKSRYVAPCFYIPKKDGSLPNSVQDYLGS